MKLKNKISGEIKEFALFDGNELQGGATLESLMKEWEDAPKEHWFVDAGGEVEEAIYLTKDDTSNLVNFGNYFSTKEEAEKAVEKLKAWKRLKDLGFKCSYHSSGYHRGTFTADFIFDADKLPIMDTFVAKDLDLLFGGEE